MATAGNRALTLDYMSSAIAQLIPKYARFGQGAKAGCISRAYGEKRYDATIRSGDFLDEEEFAG
jgi:hypothetical protein